jgi:hypothetical protein
MPYYVFAVRPFAQLERLAEFDAFKAASAHAKALRAAQPAGDSARIKVMFAESALAAEDLLAQVREAAPTGDE